MLEGSELNQRRPVVSVEPDNFGRVKPAFHAGVCKGSRPRVLRAKLFHDAGVGIR